MISGVDVRGRWIRRGRDDRGAVIVEFALFVPILMTLCFGLVEYGFAFRDGITLSGAARAGARVGANYADDPMTDYQVLVAVESALSDLDAGSTLVKIVVYEANEADGRPPSTCLDPSAMGAGGRSGLCNVYGPEDVESIQANWFGDGCSSAKRDRLWCPTSRVRTQATADWLGVYVELRRDMVTGIFPGGDMTLRQHAVMRIEPDPAA